MSNGNGESCSQMSFVTGDVPLTSVPGAENGQRPLRLNEVFHCEPRRRKLYLVTCLDDYMNANALRVKSMVCFECQQGQQNRESFAADADVEGLLDSEIWGKLMAELAATEAGQS